ncbi:hypothetical protein [Amycolatopsis sp. NPDC051128]|uniref:hypothetical protein n=1 Tax=Amycolatopsis sp. NPDC051128 TaxID=3155412 RepID=UPI003443B18A
MKTWARLGVVVATVLSAVAVSVPAASAAVNPYTPEEACANDFGGTWSKARDGHRDVKSGSTKWGDVWLMYNSSHANCVATIKSVDVGTPTYTRAWLLIEGNTVWNLNAGSFKYYAAVKATANNHCVQYAGDIYRTATPTSAMAQGARYAWGNCT